MRAILLLCLLHLVFHEAFMFSWDGKGRDHIVNDTDTDLAAECVANKAACGCCVMNMKIDRMKMRFNETAEYMKHYLQKCRRAVNEKEDNRSAFSVALNNNQQLSCQGPFDTNKVIQYQHVFINFGEDYSVIDGVFTAPHSGVYSIAATIYSTNATGLSTIACASVQVNEVHMKFQEKVEGDPEDSNTMVMAVKLKAGDQVAVVLLTGCIVCDDINHYNTFTGFLVYPTHEKS